MGSSSSRDTRTKTMRAFLLFSVVAFSHGASTVPSSTQTAATDALIARLLPKHAALFTTALLKPSECKAKSTLCFSYAAAKGGKVALKGSTGVEIAMALNHYLKHRANCSVSWPQTGGDQLRLPVGKLPSPGKHHQERSSRYNYYGNVVTFSYSFVWYTAEEWVREVDWQLMQGVNMPLVRAADAPAPAVHAAALADACSPQAYTGQEAIYQKLYNKFGMRYCCCCYCCCCCWWW